MSAPCFASGKTRYENHDVAEHRARQLERRDERNGLPFKPMHAYQCPECFCWHVGHVPFWVEVS